MGDIGNIPPTSNGGVTLNATQIAGRGSASGTGPEEPITLGTNLSMSGTTLNANAGSGAPSGAQYVTLIADAGLSAERVLTGSGRVSVTDGTTVVTLDIPNNGVGNAQLRQSIARALVANATNATANVADLAGGGAGTVPIDSGTALGFGVLTRILQNLSLEGDISPAQIIADQNNYSPTSLGTSLILRLSTDASRNITGLVPGTADGDVKILVNVGSFNVVLVSESLSSTATNRFTGGDVTLGPNESALFCHDPTTDRWRCLFKFITLGTGATQACAGNDARLSDSRAPNGTAGGDLTGTYPNPTVGTNKITNGQFRQGAALSVVGVTGNATANVADIAAATDKDILRRKGTALGFGRAQPVTVALTDAATITVDASLVGIGDSFTVTLGGNRTLGAPSNAVDGQWLCFAIKQDATGSRTLTLTTGAGGFRATEISTTLTLSTVAGKVDYLLVRYHSADNAFDLMDFRKAA